MPRDFALDQLHEVVGIEVLVDSIEARFKLSQNRAPADVDRIARGFADLGNDEMAEVMRATGRRPHHAR